jgi:UDP-3-O-[3-hydroxymyristoyl] glucosamine N-acyltransferase
MIKVSLVDLTTKIGAKLENAPNEELLVTGVASLQLANPFQVSFFTSNRYREDLVNTRAAAVILSNSAQRFCKVPMLVMDNPYLGYARVASLFNPPLAPIGGIHPSAWVSSDDVHLDSNVSIAPHAVIEAGARIGCQVSIGSGCVVGSGVEIGDNCQILANVTLCGGTRLGKRVIIHPGAVIGSDGFGNANDAGKWVKIPQLGGVVIGDDAEIGANTTIDKGTLDDTVIGMGVKLDNQIQIGHNVIIGEHTAIAGCVGIAGSTRIGCYCMIAGGVGIAGHLELVDYVYVTAGSIVLQSILEAGTYSSGTPLEPNQRWHRNYHRFKQLDKMAHRLRTLEKNYNYE